MSAQEHWCINCRKKQVATIMTVDVGSQENDHTLTSPRSREDTLKDVSCDSGSSSCRRPKPAVEPIPIVLQLPAQKYEAKMQMSNSDGELI